MKVQVAWSIKLPEKERGDINILDLCFRPDGSHIIVACGIRVLVYDSNDGNLLHSLKGHKETVSCVSYARDGKRFASGSADKSVIIWSEAFEGVLKFTHNDALQCLSFNPITNQIASCAVTDFGLWAPDIKAVPKHKVGARVTCCSWTNDGQYLALGMYNGTISIRNKVGDEKVKIERPGGPQSPVWALEWNPSKEEACDILAVADWSQNIAFYQLSGKQVGKDKQLGFDPCMVSWFLKGDFVMVGGSDSRCGVYTKDGVRIGTIGEMSSWVWSAKQKPKDQAVAVACNDATITMYRMAFNVVHGLYKDRYACRENMTDVVVHNLTTDEKVRIKCRDLVKKIAVYKNRLAVQVPDKVIIYDLEKGDEADMNYRVKDRIQQRIDCNLLVITAEHLILCYESRIQSLLFNGVKEREWTMESPVRYLKVIGGPARREGLLVGLKNGQIMKVFLDNPFPVLLLKQNTAVRCLDLSANRKKLAVVDEFNTVLVYDLATKEMIYQEPNATSVVWNSSHEDLLCYSGNGILNIKAGNFPTHQQQLQGFVVGFMGSRVLSLNGIAMTAVDVPHSGCMYQYLEKKMFNDAYQIACLGVTDSDWNTLALEAMEASQYEVAKKAFMKTRNLQYLELLLNIEERRKRGESDDQVFLADFYAYQGRFHDAAKLYKKAGHESRAMNMYTDLRMFDLAKEYVGSDSVQDKKVLITKQADWARNINEPKAAAEMYISAGEYVKAIEIIGEHGWADMMVDVARKLDKADRPALLKCGQYLRKMEQYAYAEEVYLKMGDMGLLVKLLVEAHLWEKAFTLCEQYPEHKNDVYIPYAQWLAESDKFEEAQQAFHKAGLQEDAVHVLEQLTHSAVVESRYDDAGYYYWKLSMQCLEIAGRKSSNREKVEEMLKKFEEFQLRAEIYYIYHSIHKYIDEPFTSHQPDALFNMARYLAHALTEKVPEGVSKVNVFYTLAKQSKHLKAFKLAHHCFEKLQQLRQPAFLEDGIELSSITVRAKSFHDDEVLLPMCYRCSTTNPLYNQRGNVCTNCRQPFVFSFIAFETLHVVEFFIVDSIADEEAITLIGQKPWHRKESKGAKWKEITASTHQTLRIEDGAVEEEEEEMDPFTAKLTGLDASGEYQPIVLDRDSLMALSQTDVIVCKWPKPLRYQFFKKVMDISITKCNSCNKLFHTEDYELLLLQLGHCPYCRHAADDSQQAAPNRPSGNH